MNTLKKTLSECCVFISDGDHMPPPKSKTGVPFITISNIDGDNHIDFSDVMFVPTDYYNNLPDNKKACPGDILYTVVGSFGKPVYIDEEKPFVFQRHIAILRPKENVNSRYLYYAMLNPLFYRRADKYAIGAAQRTISLDSLRKMEIDIPNESDQKQIAEILTQIDRKISLNRKINDNLAA